MHLYQRLNAHISTRKTLLLWAGWFTFINALILIVINSRYFRFAGTIDGVLAQAYAASILIGHPFFLAFGLALVVLVPTVLIWPNRALVFSTAVISATAGIAVLLLDQVVYSQFRVHLNKVMLDLVIGGGREIFDFPWRNYMIAFGCVAGLLALQAAIALFVWKKIKKPNRRFLGGTLAAIVLLTVAATHGIHAWADANFYRPVTALSRHFPLYYPLTAKRLLQKYGWVNLAQTRDQSKLKITAVSDRTISYPLKPLQFNPPDKRLNILFIVIDSWRFDMLNREVTPHIHRFISDKPVWRFSHHLSGGNGTRIGIFSLFYGLSGVHWNAMTSEQIGPVFMDALLQRNYQMGVFASAKLTTPPFNRNVFIDIEDLRSFSDGNSAWERDQSALSDWNRWLKKCDPNKPFFGFIFFDAAHTYDMPPGYPVMFKPMWAEVNYLALDEDLDPLPFFNRYKVSLHYIDSLTNRVLSDLKQQDMLNDTIVVLTGDHGQEFNENQANFWGHGGNYTDYQLKVPLVVYWPGKESKVITHVTSHLDVVPTLMTDLFGCQNPVTDYSDGRHLFETGSRSSLVVGGYFNFAIREKDRITMAYSNGNYEIFDLNHKIIKDARLNYAVVNQAMRQTARFYRN